MAAEWIVYAFLTYAAIGFVFGAIFVTRAMYRIDSNSKDTGWGFRLLIFPAAAALWPLLLRRIAKSTS